jgi:hypothetical protein
MTNIMKTLNIYKKTTLALMALTMGLSLVGCAEDSELIYQGAQQLSVKPLILDNKVSRATASDAKLNEEKLIKFNIKMFGEYDECKVDKTFTDGLESGKEEVIAKDNWKVEKDLQEGKIYNVKSVANATGTGNVQTDLDIWKPFHANNNGNKTFLMSSIENYKVTNEPNQTIPVSLTRAAAKVILKVHVKVKGYTAGQATWMLKNYNAKTTIFGNNTETDLQDGNVMLAAEGGTGEYTITTYSYAMQWKDDTKAPAIYLQVPLTTQVDGVDKTELNLYKIPVRDPKATDANAKTLARNTLYKIDATINKEGGSSEIGYITEGKLVYDVLPWSEGETTNIDANTSYLMVSPKVVYMKNVKDDISVTYKSSSPVTIVDKKVYYIDNENHQENYTEGYVETYGREKFKPYPTMMELQNGKIVINSPIPRNRFSKYIVLTLKNDEGKEATVKYKQSPLIETQNFEGQYSSRSEDGWVSPENPGGTSRDLYKAYYNWMGFKDEGYAYYARYVKKENNKTKLIEYYSGNPASGIDNNRMYIIQVSSTKNSTYNVAHPIAGKDGYSKDNVVSPAFMIASQLGAIYTDYLAKSDAPGHCKTYREVDVNGNKYDNWRLPTAAEIKFIADFQKESFKTNNSKAEKKPIKTVLSGQYYYTMDGDKIDTGMSSSGIAIRCVRDLTPEEVDKLDKQMK